MASWATKKSYLSACYILPAIRRQYVINLKRLGLKQTEIAKALNLTESAVSQYLKNKRGDEVKFTPELLDKISLSAREIATGKKKINSELQRMMRTVKESKFICGVCHTHVNTANDCTICFE